MWCRNPQHVIAPGEQPRDSEQRQRAALYDYRQRRQATIQWQKQLQAEAERKASWMAALKQAVTFVKDGIAQMAESDDAASSSPNKHGNMPCNHATIAEIL